MQRDRSWLPVLVRELLAYALLVVALLLLADGWLGRKQHAGDRPTPAIGVPVVQGDEVQMGSVHAPIISRAGTPENVREPAP